MESCSYHFTLLEVLKNYKNKIGTTSSEYPLQAERVTI